MAGIRHSAQTPAAGTTTTGATEIDVPLVTGPQGQVDSTLPAYVFRNLAGAPISFQAWNTGANTINCTVYATNDSDLTAALWIDRSTTALDTIAASAASSKVYVESPAAFTYYKVMAGNAGGVGTAQVRIQQTSVV